MGVKKIRVMMIAALMLGVVSGCSSGKIQNDASIVQHSFQLSFDWESMVEKVKSTDLSEYGLYIYEEDMLSEAEDWNCISFYNYEKDDFRSVDYQLAISYGELHKLEALAESNDFYEVPVVMITYIDNNGKGAYNAVYDLSSHMLDEDGEWFLDEDKESMNTYHLSNVRKVIGE